MAEFVDRGDNGAVPDPSWESHWSTWSPQAIQARIAEAASYGVMSAVQVRALLQHLPPPHRGADPTNTVLAEYQPAVRRYEQDAANGRVPECPTPQELAAWADAMGEELPEAFLEALEVQAIKVGQSRVGAAPMGPPVTLPPWAGCLPAPSNAAPKRPKVGRPRTAAPATQAIIEAARKVLVEEAAKGNRIATTDIAKRLQGKPVAGDRTAATIKRLLNGKLDLEKARRVALGKAPIAAK